MEVYLKPLFNQYFNTFSFVQPQSNLSLSSGGVPKTPANIYHGPIYNNNCNTLHVTCRGPERDSKQPSQVSIT